MIISGGEVIAPQALAETVPMLSNGYFYSRDGLELSGKFATYAALYRVQPSIATVVDKVANSAARLPGKTWDNTHSTGRVEDTASDFARLMANPCPIMPPFSFWRWTFSTYEIYGEAFWAKQRDSSGKTIGFLPMHPSRTMVKRDDDGNVVYVYTMGVASAGLLTVQEEDMVAFTRYNPDDIMRGLSRLEPLRSTLLNEDASRRATASWWKRGARPSVVLKHPTELSEAAAARLRESFDANHAGADNMGRTNVLEEGLDIQVIQLNAEEMQYIESRKMNLQEACMVYDVPPPVVHILDHATFSNITEQMRSMYRDTMTPRLSDVQSVIDYSVRSEFYPQGERFFEFDLSDVLRGDYETRADKANQLRLSGIYTGNQALEMVGMPRSKDPEMDKLYANAALVPLGTPMQRVTITDAVPSTPEEAASAQAAAATVAASEDQGTNPKSYRAIMGRIGRAVKSKGSDLRSALVDEHRAQIGKYMDRQQAAVEAALGNKAAGLLDPADWNDELQQILLSLSDATTQAIGSAAAADLGGKYDPQQIKDWLSEEAGTSAQNINQATADAVTSAVQGSDGEALQAVLDLFEGQVAARVAQIASTRVAALGNFSSIIAAEQNDAQTKTWRVTAKDPRPSHAQLHGVTVPLGDKFPNGMNGPGDWSGGVDEVAGCTCVLSFSKKG